MTVPKRKILQHSAAQLREERLNRKQQTLNSTRWSEHTNCKTMSYFTKRTISMWYYCGTEHLITPVSMRSTGSILPSHAKGRVFESLSEHQQQLGPNSLFSLRIGAFVFLCTPSLPYGRKINFSFLSRMWCLSGTRAAITYVCAVLISQQSNCVKACKFFSCQFMTTKQVK